MSNRTDKETRTAIRLKDFRGQNEAFVREEFLLPLFRRAGYDATGIVRTVRDARLGRVLRGRSRKGRQYVFPDFLLTNNGIALWVVDAKSPCVRLDSPNTLEQVESYARQLDCPNVMVSNAIYTCTYHVDTNGMHPTMSFSKDDVCGERWQEVMSLLSPVESVARLIDFANALRLYQTEEYLDRSLIMRVLQTYPFSDVASLLKDQDNWVHRSQRFSDRALLALLAAPHGRRAPTIVANAIGVSMNDSNVVVRENALTCLLANSHVIDGKVIPADAFAVQCATVLEEVLFLGFLQMTKQGRRILASYNPRQQWLRRYLACVSVSPSISFPLALPLGKPKGLTFDDYRRYLLCLPPMLKSIVENGRTPEATIEVVESCMGFGATQNRSVYELLLRSSSRPERSIIRHLARHAGRDQYAMRQKCPCGIGSLARHCHASLT